MGLGHVGLGLLALIINILTMRWFYWSGYRKGARVVLANWKASLNEAEENENE